MSFGTSILEGFRKGFGRGLGGQNPWFSHFFRCFFDVILQAQLERRKKRPRWANKTQKAIFWSWAPVIPRLLGKGKDRGKNTSDRIARTNYSKECRDWPAVIGQSQLEMNPARCWHTFGGRRIESPQGGDTAGHPTPWAPRPSPPGHGSTGIRGRRPVTWQHLGHSSPSNGPMRQDKLVAKRLPPRKSPQASFVTSKTFENPARTLLNRARGPPKSSPEPSKTLFLKDF